MDHLYLANDGFVLQLPVLLHTWHCLLSENVSFPSTKVNKGLGRADGESILQLSVHDKHVLCNHDVPSTMLVASLERGDISAYISMGTRFTSGILSKVSADFGLNDLAINTISRQEIFIVFGSWIIPRRT